MKEIQLETANKENFELGVELNSMFEKLSELAEKNRVNEISKREKIVEEEIKVDMIDDLKKLNKFVSDLQKTIKILEIERDDAFLRSEELQKKLESQTSSIKNSNRIIRDMEKQVSSLKRKNEEYEKTRDSMSKKLTCEDNLDSAEINYSNINPHNLYTESTKFSSICSTDVNTNYTRELSKNHHSKSLSTLLPDIFEEEVEDSHKLRISMTSNDMVKKMSDKIVVPFLKEQDTNKNKNDIYKDFFLLTFQSLKLNSKKIESYFNVNPELLYEEIIKNNIPFHEVCIQFLICLFFSLANSF
jgi:hypothetical protein